MLQFVRSKQKSLLIKIAFGVIILSFVIGYTMLTAPKDQRSAQGGDVAARVNGDEIGYGAFQNGYSNLYNLYQNIYQGHFNAKLEKQLNLPKQALQQLIEESLLIQQAKQLGLDVTQQELVDSIAQYDAFKIDGKFDRNRYLQALSYQHMKPEQFEAAQRRQLLTRKVRDRLQQGVTISDAEIEAAFHQEKDKVNLNFSWITPAMVESRVKVTDEGLQTFFKQNIEKFRIPEKVSIRYVQFDPARYKDEVETITDEELQQFYRRNLDQFDIQEQVKAAHILLRVPEDADAETVKKQQDLANNILKQLKDGADFAEMARTYSDDKSNAARGGELGTFGRGTMVGQFEDAAFALRPGQLSDIVQTPFGFHIIKVEDYTEAGVKPLAEVMDEVRAGLTQEKAQQLAYEKAMDAYNINRKTGSLETAADANDLKIKETALFTADAAIDGIGRIATINQHAFTLKKGELARPVQTPQGVYLFSLKERQTSHLPELAQVKPVVEQAYRTDQAQVLAKKLADKLLAGAISEKSLRSAAKNLDIKVEESGQFSRNLGFSIPGIGPAKELAEAAFSLTEETPIAPKVYTVGNRYLVASLKEAEIADFKSIDNADREQLKNRLLAEKKEQAVSEKVSQLWQQAEIEIMVPELITAFNAGSKKS